jgi:hypothetical protein
LALVVREKSVLERESELVLKDKTLAEREQQLAARSAVRRMRVCS